MWPHVCRFLVWETDRQTDNGVGEKQLFSELGVALVPLAGSIHFSSFLLCTGTQLRQWEKTKRAAAYKQPMHLRARRHRTTFVKCAR